jgi:uncharacterized membrane protein YphA (DoxX/SURF4 family)
MTGQELSTLAIILQYILGISLAIAGLGKIQHLTTFVQGVISYRILPIPLARWYGRLLPIVEIGTGILFLTGLWVPAAAFVSILMFSSFALAVAVNLMRKQAIACYCFGTDASAKIGWHTLLRIFLFLLISTIIIFTSPRPTDSNLVIVHPVTDLINFIPIILLTAFGLMALALVEISPLVVKAWNAPAVKPNKPVVNAIWEPDPESPRDGEQSQ